MPHSIEPSRMASIAPTVSSQRNRGQPVSVLEAGILKQSVSYDQVIDMRFVNQVRKELNVQ
jgi:pseudouridine-5'-phosphate glycosidase